jgi:hypothetical protein
MKAGEIDNFDMLLSDAQSSAKSKWEIDFVAGIGDRYDQYEDECIVSENQLEILERIAWK